MKRTGLILVLLLGQTLSAQEASPIPSEPKGLPIAFLAKLNIGDASRQLTEKERHLLCRLFVKSYVVSIRQYKQDFLLDPGAPIYRLLKTNFPAVVQREGEGGIFLGEITRFINTLPDYRGDVDDVLKSGLVKKKNCDN